MNKNIFRGWYEGDKETQGCWVYGVLLDDGSGDPCILNETDAFSVARDSVGQSTGMVSDEGKAIYEGDIVVVPGTYPYFDDGDPNYVASVEWCFAGFHTVLHCINPNRSGISTGVNSPFGS